MCMNCWYPLTHHLYLHHSGLKCLNCSWCVWCLHCEPSPPSTSSSLPLLHVCPPLHRLSLCIHHLFVYLFIYFSWVSFIFLSFHIYLPSSSFFLSTLVSFLPPSFSFPLHPRPHVLPPSLSTLLPLSSSLSSLPALAASGGQLPISSLEGAASHMLLGGPGGPAVPASLRQSLFLNRPTLLPMVTGSMATATTQAMGLVSGGSSSGCGPRPPFSHSPPPGASDLMSPTSCHEDSASPCSSPASFCSFSEASPPPLGGAMAEWSLTDSQSILSGGRGGGRGGSRALKEL